ncbi:pentatricopeptide repeat-containing protein At2g13600 [Oryza brachyantha]|uniref:Pentatricopeptide repeat-containing protein n=1 Tax=Oryza brachyantha TaxID=4533 RepID=J3LY28_ORYBR|nr:pentatricopeptide repeat-containing protein At2g13600 [Oryza brachyantha]
MARPHHHGLHLVSHLRASAPLADLLRSAPGLPAARAAHARALRSPFASETFLLNTLVSTYARLGSLRDARRVFDGIPHRNTFSYNALLSAYALLGRADDARALFGAIPDPDQCSYNAVIAALAQHGRGGDALRFLAAMHADDFVLNAYSFASGLSACASEKAWRTGEQVHALVTKSSRWSDVYIGSALVDMYAKCERPEEAQKVFDAMPERNIVSWNSLITCYEQNGPVDEALVLFVRMMNDGFMPDEVTFASVMSACAGLAMAREGRQVHACMVKSDRLREDMVLNNALVDMYAKCGRTWEARCVFDRMAFRSVVSETSMVTGYAKSANVEDAQAVFLQMVEKNVIAWNVLIAAYAQNGEEEEALRLFVRLKRESVWPTHYTYGNVLNSCANLANLPLGQQTHAHVLKEGFRFDFGPESDVFVGNSLVDMYLKTGSIDDGAKVFERMAARDDVSWNAMIVGYAQNGRAKDALHLFERMLCSNERPDSVTMIGVLSACGHSGLVKEGRRYFQTMTEDHGITPTRDHYTCMIDLLGRAGHLKEVEELIEGMPMEPDAVLWASLLGACRLHKNIEMGERAAGKLFELDPDNSGPYVLLSNMYAELGKWADVFRVRRSMKHRGVSKQPGCSWIEIGKKVNVFLARDNVHPCRNEILDTLRIIQMQMTRMSVDAGIADDLMNFYSEACG